MNGLTGKERAISWVCQLLAAGILGMAAYTKFIGADTSVFIFTELSMEPNGRIIIGLIEGASVALMLTRSFAHHGAFLGFSVMIGALIAHLSVIGISVQSDGGMMFGLMIIVIITTMIIIFIRRRSLPFIGTLIN